jgi:class 3 adenylate cyclase/HEAT repeat protein
MVRATSSNLARLAILPTHVMNISVIGIDEIVLPGSGWEDLGTGARSLPRPHWCHHRLGSSGVVEEISEPRSQHVLAAAIPAPAALVAILVLDIEKSRQISPNDPTTLSDITYALRNLAKQVPQAFGKQEPRGDGLLQCFSDALAAAVCAVSLRHLLEDPAWRLRGVSVRGRIALHLGHAQLQQDGLAFGDSLAVASRLEPIVEPGAIWTSAAFAEALEQRVPKVGLTTRYLGLKTLAKDDGDLVCHELIDTNRPVPGAALSYQPQDDPLANCQRLLRSDDEADQIAAIQALVSIGTWAAVKLLVNCARSDKNEPPLRRRCLTALQQLAEPDLATLIGSIVDAEQVLSLKRLSIELLGACASPDAIEKLSHLASDKTPSPAVREAALLALRHLSDASLDQVLTDALKEKNPDLVNAACVAASTRKLSESLADRLISLAKSDGMPESIREIALEAFLARGSEGRYLNDLIELAKDPEKSSQLRMLALEELADIGSGSALVALQEIAEQPSDTMRRAALAFVLAVKSKPTPTHIRMKPKPSESRINEVLTRIEGRTVTDRYLSDIA